MKKGQIFFATIGEYSDYGVFGSWRALVDFSIDAEIRARTESDGSPGRGSRAVSLFDRLVSEGKVEEYEIKEVHLGSCGMWEEDPAGDAGDVQVKR